MKTREELEIEVKIAMDSVSAAQKALADFDGAAENNVFDTLDVALGEIEYKLMNQAHADCEGSYNCGADTYTQEFIVDCVRYIGTLKCEYNRHDKTYYYIDEHDFTYAAIEG